MIFVLDNYDSFTYNLVQRLGEIDSSLDIQVARNDQITLEEIAALSPERIIIHRARVRPTKPVFRVQLSKNSARRFPSWASVWDISASPKSTAQKSSATND